MTNEVELLKKQLDEATEMYIQLAKVSSKEIAIRDKALELCIASMCDNMETATPLIEMWMRVARGEIENGNTKRFD